MAGKGFDILRRLADNQGDSSASRDLYLPCPAQGGMSLTTRALCDFESIPWREFFARQASHRLCPQKGPMP